jgi:hypothetical protein
MPLAILRKLKRVTQCFHDQVRVSRIGYASLWLSLVTCTIFVLQRFWSIDFELRAGLLSWGSLMLVGNCLTLAIASLSLIADNGKILAALSFVLLALVETYSLPLIVVMAAVNFFWELLLLLPTLLLAALWLRRRRMHHGPARTAL